MSEHLFTSITSIALAIVGLAIVATLVGSNAKTGSVINSAGQALAADIKAATGPVITGGGLTGLGAGFGGGGFTSF